jgi:hypothetical protein
VLGVVLIVCVVGLVIGEVAVDVAHSRRALEARAAASYVLAVQPIVAGSSMLPATVAEVRDRAARLGRDQLEADLSTLVSGARQAVTELGELGLAPPERRVGQLLETVLTDRLHGSEALTGGVLVAIGVRSERGSRVTASERLLDRAASDFEAADRALRSVVALLPRTAHPSLLASNTWISRTSAWRPSSLAVFATTLASSSRLRARSDLVLVAVSLEPAAVRITGVRSSSVTPSSTTTTTVTTVPGAPASSTASPSTTTTTIPLPTTTTLQLPPPGSVSVLPPVSEVSVVVVCANAGNVSEPGVSVRAVLTAIGGTTSPSRHRPASTTPSSGIHERRPTSSDRATAQLGRLAAGATRYLELGPLSVQSGRRYRVSVTVESAGRRGGTSSTASFVITIAPSG